MINVCAPGQLEKPITPEPIHGITWSCRELHGQAHVFASRFISGCHLAHLILIWAELTLEAVLCHLSLNRCFYLQLSPFSL